MKVYCNDCKRRLLVNVDYLCAANYSWEDTPDRRKKRYAYCSDVNRNNDCTAFTKKCFLRKLLI